MIHKLVEMGEDDLILLYHKTYMVLLFIIPQTQLPLLGVYPENFFEGWEVKGGLGTETLEKLSRKT